MSDRTSAHIEVVTVSGRRTWTVQQKLSMLRDAFGPGGSVRGAAERHRVGTGSLYTWRRCAMSGQLGGLPKPVLPSFAEVRIAEPARSRPTTPASPSPPLEASGRIEIELPTGVRLSVDGSVDADALGRVLAVLQR